jgi:hypothetical protein
MDAFKLGGPFNIHDTGSAPDLPGLYVWYARFRVEEADWHSAFADGNDTARDRLLRAIRGHSLKFGSQEIRVRAEAHFSSVWKGVLSEDQSARWRSHDYASAEQDGFAAKISPAIDHDGMRELLVSLLDTGFPLFCSPLYLGKASDQPLRSRLKQHSRHFLDLWDRYIKDRQFIERIENPKDFAERAIKLGFSPEDLYCMTLALDADAVSGLQVQDVAVLIESAEWLLNRWATPMLGRQ